MDCKLKVITRNSPLALLQVEEFFTLFPQYRYEVTEVSSFGDRHKDISLMDGTDPDFFTRELDRAVLDGEADIAVHSAKDLPYPLHPGLELYCLTEAADKSDSLVSRGGLTLEQLPPGSRIGTSSRMRRSELLALRQDIEVVSIRGTIEERIAQVDSGYVDALIVATCALQRLGLVGRSAQRLPFKTHPLQGNLGVVGRRGDGMKRLFEEHDIRRRFGRVALVGFGPGNPDLLTLGGDRALREADVIFHDDLIDKPFLNRYSARKVYVGKRSGREGCLRQDEINSLVYEAAVSGQRVVRLKGGDPMVFAHGREELDFLQSRFVDVDVIPGVSAGIALASCTHIPLTHRGMASSVAFVSGHGEEVQRPDADTLLYYMGAANVARIAQALIDRGRNASTPAALVHNVSLPDQRTFFSSLGELTNALIKGMTPLLIIVGDVVRMERRVQRVLYTGTAALGADGFDRVTHIPLIRITGAELNAIDRQLLSSMQFDWIVFTSRYGVCHFFRLLDSLRIDIRKLTGIKIASVGPVTTAEVKARHLLPDVESPTQSAEGLLRAFRDAGVTGARILLPRSDKGVAYLPEGLEAMGNEVTDIAVYHNTANPNPRRVDLSAYDKIVFSSPSGVDAFKEIYGGLPDATLLVAKGSTTFKHLEADYGNYSSHRRKPPR